MTEKNTFGRNLRRARSHLILVIGLFLAFGASIYLEGWDSITTRQRVSLIENTQTTELAPSTPLTSQELEWAKIAWQYFVNNTIAETGLANSADKYTASTLWDTASYLMGAISAERLGIIKKQEFDQRIEKALESLAKIPLYNDELPNKSYSTLSLAMVDYENNDSDLGIGWSALDIGRFFVPMNVLVWNYPQHSAKVRKVISRWKFDRMLQDSYFYGGVVEPGEEHELQLLQEGRLGYEQYSAKSLSLIGEDVANALDYFTYLRFEDVNGIQVGTDVRDNIRFGANNAIVSEPYILDGIEFGFDQTSQELAWRVYQAQEARFQQEGILTAVSEDNIDEAPYFIYNTVFSNGKAWNTLSEDGREWPEFKSISTKAVFGWHALYNTPYTKTLLDSMANANDPKLGWFSGIYEKDMRVNKALTANTNGIILESLAYKAFGRLINPYSDDNTSANKIQ
jgi:hypothetical protein